MYLHLYTSKCFFEVKWYKNAYIIYKIHISLWHYVKVFGFYFGVVGLFDLFHILANAKTIDGIDRNLRNIIFEQIPCWAIFMDDSSFTDVIVLMYDEITNRTGEGFSRMSQERIDEMTSFFDIARTEYPDIFPLRQRQLENSS